ncbi:EAL domain-containing protein [Haliea sp. E1-2-M8]|uniref:bifunctional diguanylate cyclase/phosphodiesterase n=1 Tax=Haliea sp. E1-2-M8 TaxID=3064706 RepID=UPI00271B0274|nr:EAL domain-containing protein [Haliea sp. E1-2-M8]MDO8864039.1 EAL domain-containing protein [Haliea sp. E1-2-M8]
MSAIVPSSLWGRLLLLLCIIIVLFCSLLAHSVFDLRAREAVRTQQNALTLARLTRDAQLRYIEEARNFLPLVAQLQQKTLATGGSSCDRVLGELLQRYPHYANLGIIDADGSVRCSALPLPTSTNLADRSYFRRALETEDFAVGDYQVGRITEVSSINVALPLHDIQHRVDGVLFAALDLTRLSENMADINLPADTTITLIGASGTVLARYPADEDLVGQSALQWPVHQHIVAAGREGTAETTDHFKVDRLYAFTPISAFNSDEAYISVGIPTRTAYADLNQLYHREVWLILVVVVLASIIAWLGSDRWLLQPLAALGRASEALKSGNLGARTGLTPDTREMAQLAATFDAMADSLQTRYETILAQDSELVRSHRALKTLSGGNRALIRARDEQALLDEMCRVAVEVGGYAIAWVAYAEHDADRSVVPVARRGVDLAFLQELKISWADSDAGQGPTGTAIRRGQPYVGRDLQSNPKYRLWHDRNRQQGLHSSISLPLQSNGTPLGAFTIYSSDPDAFDTEEQAILQEMAEDMAYGIKTLRLRQQHEAAQEHIHKLALYDTLTGLPNHIQFQDLLAANIQARDKDKSTFALLIIGLDRFRDINTTLGFEAGDRVLSDTGLRIQGALVEGELLARLRGDEFALLLPGATADTAAARAETLRQTLSELYNLDGFTLAVNASIGIVLFPEHATTTQRLIQQADVALQQAKQSGLGQAVYSAEYDEQKSYHLALAGKLHRALEKGELTLYYQPKISMASGQIVGFEALARWFHPRDGMIRPDIFIGVAESTGMIRAVSSWVLTSVLQQLAQWRENGLRLPVAINLSPRNLQDAGLLESLERFCTHWQLERGMLEVEVTENAIAENAEQARASLLQLRALGIPVFIDDFGTGYSSLSTLRTLPFSSVKIDKSFVLEMLEDRDAATIVRSTIKLAHDMDLTVIAEGVENEAMWNELKDLGCDAGQGFYMGKPMPENEVTKWLATSNWGIPQ